MAKTNADKCRDYRAKKKAAKNKTKKKVMTSTERVRKFREKQKALQVISAVENAVPTACNVSYIQDAVYNSNEIRPMQSSASRKKLTKLDRPKNRDHSTTIREYHHELIDKQIYLLKKNDLTNNITNAGPIKTEQEPEPFLNNERVIIAGSSYNYNPSTLGDTHHDPQCTEEHKFEANCSEEPTVKYENIDDNFDESCTWSSFGGSDGISSGINQYKSDATSKVKSERSEDTSFIYEIYSLTDGPIQNKEDPIIQGFKIKTEIDVYEDSITPSAVMQDINGPYQNEEDLSIEGFQIKTEIDVCEDSITSSAVMQDIIRPSQNEEDLSIKGFKIKTEIDVCEDSTTPSAITQDIIRRTQNEEDLSIEGFKIKTEIDVSADSSTLSAVMQDIIIKEELDL